MIVVAPPLRRFRPMSSNPGPRNKYVSRLIKLAGAALALLALAATLNTLVLAWDMHALAAYLAASREQTHQLVEQSAGVARCQRQVSAARLACVQALAPSLTLSTSLL
jgi:hypothetical protein